MNTGVFSIRNFIKNNPLVFTIIVLYAVFYFTLWLLTEWTV